jgi:hypothetical protein
LLKEDQNQVRGKDSDCEPENPPVPQVICIEHLLLLRQGIECLVVACVLVKHRVLTESIAVLFACNREYIENTSDYEGDDSRPSTLGRSFDEKFTHSPQIVVVKLEFSRELTPEPGS